MKRLLPLVLLASCAGPSASQGVQGIVPLIKAERYDEAAANPDLLAPAFVEALRQLNAEAADPKKVVRVANFFFDNYPFCVKDLPIDESIFEAVVVIHHEANLKLTSAIPSCRQVEGCDTLDELVDLFEGWHDEHLDGGRCARKILGLTLHAERSGLSVTFKTVRLRDPRQGNNLLCDLFKACADPFSTSPWLPMIAFRVAALDGWMYQGRRHEAWCDRWELNHVERWKRLFHGRLLWLGSLRQEPKIQEGGYRAILVSKFDSRLEELGRALDDFEVILRIRDSRPKSPPSILPAARTLVRAGAGTPLADVARLGGVMYCQDVELEAEAEAWFREQAKSFDQPLRAAYALLYMADPRFGNRTLDQSIQLAREAYELDPRGTSAISALALWGDRLHAAVRDAEAIERLEAAVARGEAPLGFFEDEDADFARSAAGRLLGELLLERRNWSRAFEVIRDWDLYTTCGTTGGDREWQYKSMALCLEKLDRAAEACDFHWEAAWARGMEKARAKEVLEIYSSRGRLQDLLVLVRNTVTAIKSWGNTIDSDSGFKWLADELKVPVR